jgi:hypothetical protein
MGFALFMSSAAGRILRIVGGLVMIGLGVTAGTTGGYVLAILGLVPLALGVFNWCLFAPLLGVPFKGSELRKSAEGQPRSS